MGDSTTTGDDYKSSSDVIEDVTTSSHILLTQSALAAVQGNGGVAPTSSIISNNTSKTPSDKEEDSLSISSSSRSIRNASHGNSYSSSSHHRRVTSIPSSMGPGSDRGDNSSSHSMVGKLKGEIAILRDALDKLNATDIVTVNEKLRGAVADSKLLKQKNNELKNRVMQLEEALELAYQQSQRPPTTPRMRILASRNSNGISNEETDGGNSVTSASEDTVRLNHVIVSLSAQIEGQKATIAQKDGIISYLRKKKSIAGSNTSSDAFDKPSSEDPNPLVETLHNRSAYALSLAMRDQERQELGQTAILASNQSRQVVDMKSPEMSKSSSQVAISTRSSVTEPVAPEVAWATIRAKSTLVSGRFTRKEWELLQIEAIPWLQCLIDQYRAQDLKTIRVLCDDIAQLSTHTQTSSSQLSGEASTTAESNRVSSLLSQPITQTAVVPAPTNQRNGKPKAADSREDGFSFGSLLLSFLGGVICMGICCGVVLSQLVKLNFIAMK